MKKVIILTAGLILFLAGCVQEPVCNDPYILVGYDCCLDEDSNGVCDTDEKHNETSEKEPTFENPIVVEKIVERIIYLEGECRKFDFDVNLEACVDDEITFSNLNKGTLHYADVKLYDKNDNLISEERFRTQLVPYKKRTYQYDDVETAVKAVVIPTVEFEDEDFICEEKTFALKCHGDED